MLAIDKAFERNAALLLAAETWADGYHDAPDEYAKMLKTAARLERKLLLFFKEQARTSSRFINWYAYANALQEINATRLNAYDVGVIVTNNVDDDNRTFISVVIDEVANAMALGTQAAQKVYSYPYGLSAVDSSIQRQTRKQVASLVGKRVLDDGTIVDNPNAQYVISNTTRKNIQESIQTSLAAGETIEQATERVKAVIKDPRRAKLIAHQETANAYTSGLHMYGQASGAVGKQWKDNGAKDICKQFTLLGPIPFTQAYDNLTLQHPTAHIGCRCYERLIYQGELDRNPDMFKPKAKPPTPKPAPAKPKEAPKTATFTKGNKTYDFKLSPIEANVISENNIAMSVAPPNNRKSWNPSMQGVYSTNLQTLSKTMHLRNPAAPDATHTFYHEIGHAIDNNLYKGKRISASDEYKAAHNADRLEVFRDRVTRQYKDQLSSDEIDKLLKGHSIRFTKIVREKQRTYITKISSSYATYAKSYSEVFADGYSQWRANPIDFAQRAPALTKLYEGLE